MRIAFIGGWGHHYLRGLLPPGQSPVPIDPAAASDGHDPDAAKRWAASHNVTRWFDTPDQIFDEFKPDIVSIGAVYGFNSDLAAQSLEKNIPTVCDKPIAANWQQLSRLKNLLASDPRRILLTEFDFRSRPDFRAARQAVADGLIGDPILITAQKSYRFGARPPWYADRAAYGGTLLWIASHGIDAVQWVSGRQLKRVIGRQNNLSRPQFGSMEDHLALLMELDNGGTAVVHADFLRPAASPTHGDDRLRIVGADGLLEVIDNRCTLTTARAAPARITDRATVRPIHLEMLDALTSPPNPWFSTAQSLATAELLLHARDAADAQRWIDL
jgi:predicted dehydrogenase